MRDECVLVSGAGAGAYSLPIWWDDFTAGRDDAGRLVVRDGDGAAGAIARPFV